MRSRLVTALMVAATAAATTTTASAHPGPDTCAGPGVMTTSALFTPVPGPVTFGGFSLTLPTGCAGGGGLSMGGSLNGYCGDATGTGVAAGHHSFSYVLFGTTMTITGSVVGELQVLPGIGQSCTQGGATSFVVVGSVSMLPSPPEACAGSGTMTTPTLSLRSAGTMGSGSFVLTLPNACPSGGLTLSGNIHGYCGDATGSGAAKGHGFGFVLAATTMTFTGDVVGELDVTPDIGQSCIDGATSFVAAGTLTLL
jgi:hypothetical protein